MNTQFHIPPCSGFKRELHPNGELKKLEFFKDGLCLAILELSISIEEGEFRCGIAGEKVSSGMLEPLGPFAGSGAPEPLKVPFAQWVQSKIDQMSSL